MEEKRLAEIEKNRDKNVIIPVDGKIKLKTLTDADINKKNNVQGWLTGKQENNAEIFKNIKISGWNEQT